MIGVYMCIDHVSDTHSLGGVEIDVAIQIPLLRIDDGGVSFPGASQNVRGAAGIEVIKRSEDHGLNS